MVRQQAETNLLLILPPGFRPLVPEGHRFLEADSRQVFYLLSEISLCIVNSPVVGKRGHFFQKEGEQHSCLKIADIQFQLLAQELFERRDYYCEFLPGEFDWNLRKGWGLKRRMDAFPVSALSAIPS
jgi:hypothetical protein